MPSDKYPSIEYVRQCLRYEDGKLYWLERPREHFKTDRGWLSTNARCAGGEAGCVGMCGNIHTQSELNPRCIIGVSGVHIYRSIIVWAIHHGRWPDVEIDHEDHDTLNDKIDNLREATRSQQLFHTRIRKDNTSGFKGVRWKGGRKKWQARIWIGGRDKHLGYFDSFEEAKVAYLKAAEIEAGEFLCVDRKDEDT